MSAQSELNIDVFFDNIITSYETRIQKIQNVFQTSENITGSSFSLFNNVLNSLNDLKRERDMINSRLCETMAKNGSLRKKDYNTMMAGILSTLDEKERAAENLFLNFIEAQKEAAKSLKNSLLDIKDITSRDAGEKIAIIKDELSQISKLQEVRKEIILKTYIDFQCLHNKIMESLEGLLEKGDQIRIEDIKNVRNKIIKEIK